MKVPGCRWNPTHGVSSGLVGPRYTTWTQEFFKVLSGPNFFEKVTCRNVQNFHRRTRLLACRRIRPMVSGDTALVGILPLHAMSWPFALHVSCRMHPPVLHSTCSRLRRTCHAPLLVIGPRYASHVASFLSYNAQSAYLKVSS